MIQTEASGRLLCLHAVADLIGGEMNECPPSPRGSKFFKFHAVFGKIWQNRMFGSLSGGLAPSSRGNPGSATDTDSNFSYKKI